MHTKYCNCCGRELTDDNASKAYKDLCKECYAALVRNRRQQIGKKKAKQLTDWEQVRIRAAIEITAALSLVPYRTYTTLNGDTRRESYDSDFVVKCAMDITDALVAKLKGGKE